jgi:hypothetical protein
MDIAAKKLELMDWLLHLEDESKLRQVIAFKANMETDIVAYHVKGYPITREEYIGKVQEADERISSGKSTTMEDLEKEIENW